MIRSLLKIVIGLLVLVGLAAVVVAAWFWRGGIGSKAAPGAVETTTARALRSAAIPTDAKERKNPVPASDLVIHEGMEHFADHCAVCHDNNGSGETLFGRGMYPRPPDLRAAETQQLSDGELFYIIENGVKFTGMPAFGSGSTEGVSDSWALVHFVRHLPKLTEQEIEKMKKMNPQPAVKPHRH
jgi:mono/diheme cytochrome c family protein